MFIFLDESYNLKDRTLPQFISINGFRVVDVTKVWKRWKEYRLPFVGKARIHGTDRLFEPLRAKCFKLLANQPDITLLSVMQEIKLIPPKGDMVYYDKDGKLLFDNVYAETCSKPCSKNYPCTPTKRCTLPWRAASTSMAS